jgi:hypothetical protein
MDFLPLLGIFAFAALGYAFWDATRDVVPASNAQPGRSLIS